MYTLLTSVFFFHLPILHGRIISIGKSSARRFVIVFYWPTRFGVVGRASYANTTAPALHCMRSAGDRDAFRYCCLFGYFFSREQTYRDVVRHASEIIALLIGYSKIVISTTQQRPCIEFNIMIDR